MTLQNSAWCFLPCTLEIWSKYSSRVPGSESGMLNHADSQETDWWISQSISLITSKGGLDSCISLTCLLSPNSYQHRDLHQHKVACWTQKWNGVWVLYLDRLVTSVFYVLIWLSPQSPYIIFCICSKFLLARESSSNPGYISKAD